MAIGANCPPFSVGNLYMANDMPATPPPPPILILAPKGVTPPPPDSGGCPPGYVCGPCPPGADCPNGPCGPGQTCVPAPRISGPVQGGGPGQDSYGIPYGAVYLYGGDNKLHWLTDIDTFAALGFTFDQVIKVDPLCLFIAGMGTPLPSIHSVSDVGVLLQTINSWGAGTVSSGSTGSGSENGTGTGGTTTSATTGFFGGLGNTVTSVETGLKAHEKAVVAGVVAFGLWKTGILGGLTRSLFGHRRY